MLVHYGCFVLIAVQYCVGSFFGDPSADLRRTTLGDSAAASVQDISSASELAKRDSRPCPPADEKAKCSDDGCKGDGSDKCTVQHKGCDCTPDDPCPSGANTLLCVECGGHDSNDLCHGIKDKGSKYKGCFCNAIGDPLPYQPGIDRAMANAAFARLPELTAQSYDNPPGVESTCQKAGWGAPQRDSDGKPSVTDSFTKWCTANDGKAITRQPKGVDTVFAMFPQDYYSYWLSATNWYSAPANVQCGDTVKIRRDQCIEAFTTAMDDCNPGSGSTHGGSYPLGCISYNITMDAGRDPHSPPWNSKSASPY